MADKTIIINQEDVNNPLHPNLWANWMDTLGVDREATEVCLKLSALNENKKAISPKQEALDLLDKANDILTKAINNIGIEEAEDIFCPLGEVISNVEALDME